MGKRDDDDNSDEHTFSQMITMRVVRYNGYNKYFYLYVRRLVALWLCGHSVIIVGFFEKERKVPFFKLQNPSFTQKCDRHTVMRWRTRSVKPQRRRQY
jgi:hypothetical protein